MSIKRGALIVLEGCDRVGKSTHIKLLLEALRNKGNEVLALNFPDRTTVIGQMIDAYIKREAELKDEAVHLLFSANRWEAVPKIEKALLSGQTVIVDRYAFSGVAYSSAKGIDFDWCKSPDVGLPKPDLVLYLSLPLEAASERNEYGVERYESLDFQNKVKIQYELLYEKSYWKTVETNREISEVHADLLSASLKAVEESQSSPLSKLWLKH